MISSTLEFEDFNGNPVKETFYFNMNKAELTRYQFRKDGSTFTELLIRISDGKATTHEVIAMIEDIFRESVGRRSEDGKRFIKNDEIRSEFFDTDAYSTLLFKCLEDPEYLSKLIEGIIPKDLKKDMEKQGLKDLDNYDREKLMKLLRDYKDPFGDKPADVESA